MEMATKKQIVANRRNAAKSTGPKSKEGKKNVRMNALKHGLQAEHVVIPGEDPEEFLALLRGVQEHYRPVGMLEQGLVERIAHGTWRLERARVIEIAMMRREHEELKFQYLSEELDRLGSQLSVLESLPDEDEAEDGESNVAQNKPEELSDPRRVAKRIRKLFLEASETCERAEEEVTRLSCGVDRVFLQSERSLERLSRYETTIERQLRNAMQDLERIQTARKAEAAESATAIDVTDLNHEES